MTGESIATVSSVSAFGACIFYVLWRYIGNKYREFDAMETKREKLEYLKNMISNSMTYFLERYGNKLETQTVYETINSNKRFMAGIIEHFEDIDTRLKYYDRLYKCLYETEYRLRTKFEDVVYILGPMNNLRTEIVNLKLSQIKDNLEEND